MTARKIKVKENNVAILVAEPRLLIVRVATRADTLVNVTAHAPHRAATNQATPEQYWQHATEKV